MCNINRSLLSAQSAKIADTRDNEDDKDQPEINAPRIAAACAWIGDWLGIFAANAVARGSGRGGCPITAQRPMACSYACHPM